MESPVALDMTRVRLLQRARLLQRVQGLQHVRHLLRVQPLQQVRLLQRVEALQQVISLQRVQSLQGNTLCSGPDLQQVYLCSGSKPCSESTPCKRTTLQRVHAVQACSRSGIQPGSGLSLQRVVDHTTSLLSCR